MPHASSSAHLMAVLFLCLSIPSLLLVTSELSQRSPRGKYPRLELFRHIQPPTSDPYELFQQFGFSERDIARMKSEFPLLLTKFDTNHTILPRLAFAQALFPNTCVGSITLFPFYFSYDLEQVIAVRCAYLETIGYDLPVDLRSFLECSEEEFIRKFPVQINGNFYQWKRKFLRGGLHAARECDEDLLRLLFKYGYDPSSDIDRQGRTLLHWVSGLGKHPKALDTARLLVEVGQVDPQALADDGSSALMWAATGGSLALFEYLCGKGCDPFLTDHEKSSAFMWAAGSGEVDICRWIKDLSIQLKQPSPAWETNVFGCLPIHFAASGGQVESIKYLIEVCGADVLIQNNGHGHDSLTKAVAFKQSKAVSFLCSVIPQVERLILLPRPWDSKDLNLIEIAQLVNCQECLMQLKMALEECDA